MMASKVSFFFYTNAIQTTLLLFLLLLLLLNKASSNTVSYPMLTFVVCSNLKERELVRVII